MCATLAAIVPKLHNLYYDQNACATRNNLRYFLVISNIRYLKNGSGLLTVFLFKRNIIYICISKSENSYPFLISQLEFLHTQVFF